MTAPHLVGSRFETDVRKALEKARARHSLFYHRLQDSKAAGQYLPSSPADFLVGFQGRAWMLECKASEQATSLASCLRAMTDDAQIAHHAWWHVAGNRSMFLFYSVWMGAIEVWEGADVVAAYHGGKGAKLGKPRTFFPHEELHDHIWRLF